MDKQKTGTLIGIGAVAILLILYFWAENHGTDRLTLYGNIDIRRADVGFRVFGKLKAMRVEEGDAVAKGDLLAELDPEPYINSLKEAESKVSSLTNSLFYATEQLQRRGALIGGKSVSEENYQQAFYNQKVLEANLEEANAALQNAKIRLEDTRLFSPSEGYIFTRIREPGTVLNVGEPAYSLAVSEPVWARTYISEPDLGKIHPGMRAKVITDTPENPIYDGRIGFISPIAEFTPKNVESPDLRTNLVYQLRIVIDKPDKGLRQGMPVTIEITNEE